MAFHETIAGFLRSQPDFAVRTATLDQPEHGLSEETLNATDVLIWRGHAAHEEVVDQIAARAQQRVLEGTGLIALHSAHYSKVFKRLMETTCSLKWRIAKDRERLWSILPTHPICHGISDCFELPIEGMYGEPFCIPSPDELGFHLVVYRRRSVSQWMHMATRPRARLLFPPGHETFPTYHDPLIQRVTINAARWACIRGSVPFPERCHRQG